jgi:stage II sporulation protein D
LGSKMARMAILRATIAALVATAVLASAPASAGAAWTIRGHGFGHGVGLSQWGAYGYAKHGSGYRDILGHYYRHTKLGRAEGKVRVLLGAGEGAVGFSGARTACGERLRQARDYSFDVAAGGVVLRDGGGGRLARCGAEGKASAGVTVDGFGSFRGSLVARATGGNMLVINSVRIEGYVKGVVPNEVPASWPADALRAQAVVARTYGLATDREGPFDQYDDTRSQVYGGRDSETRETNRAVADTAKQVVTYAGELAVTYYFSTSGGQTENSEFGFDGGNPVAYLKSVEDPYDDASPVHRWRETISDGGMESKLGGLYEGRLKAIDVLETGRSPRIVRARVVGSSGSKTVSGDTLRARLGLRSTWAKFSHR